MEKSKVFLSLIIVLSAYPSFCKAEKIYCSNGEVFEGQIISVGKDYIWVKQEFGKRGIGIKIIDKILNSDGSVSKYDYKSAINKIQSYIQKKNYGKAKELCGSLIEYYKENSQLYYLRAVLSQKMGDSEKAITDYSFLIEHDLADAKVFNNLATIYALKQEFKQAQELFARSIQKDPGIAQVHNNLADLLMRQQDYSQAGQEYQKVIALEPGNTKAIYNLGIIYIKSGDYAKAKQSWEKVLSLDPDDTDAKSAIQNLNRLLKGSKNEA